ncbi:molecular chaperone HtpG [Anaerorhabdus sp.]|uniref:molecular chaperone HtpG n=1 Tax=Anaerorhabdus sp. TaxID=1872524 RepID=UPI002B1FD235|nr:molecular chaperone HtpG [Anaerorhabdus sp.]MEA4873925.1 molecular chaperone HtpG [Anaerorhabdus sp.]
MAKKQFKAESKRLLDLMINSIYTNREIFLRELISNASDALDKRYYLSLTDDGKRIDKKNLKIDISADKANRTLTISDTGIGMTEKELQSNLGTIAKSGSLEFKKELDDATKNIDIIGQFGVGFYSAFMVAKKITVETKSIHGDVAYSWVSEGEDGYTINTIDRDQVGTTITLELKDDTAEDNYSDFLESYQIQQLVTKYSDYVRYPIEMMVETQKPKSDNPEEFETVVENKTLNSMVPLWKKNRKKIKPEEYNEFYKSKFMDWEDPQKVIHYNVEGNISYNALLFIPGKTPYNFYNADYEPGLQLYCKGVFIMDKAKDLLPDYFRFVKGLIDSDDLNLNISREILQQDRQMKVLAQSIEKKIKNNLEEMLKGEREEYEKFFTNFGLTLKYGIYQDYGMHKDTLQNLILFKSSKEDKYVTLEEYVERMQEGQDLIYYACGETIDAIKKLPQMERLQEKNLEVLYFIDDVDEFAINILNTYKDKKFKSVNQGDLGLDSEEEKKEKEEKAKENQSLLSSMKDALTDKVKEVRISSRLKSHPVCLVSDEGISLEMEKVLSQAPNSQGIKANKILEINPDHEIFKTLQKAYEKNPDQVKDYADVLYNQALLIEGLPIEDPIAYANKICDLMIHANK